jgi:uncharacterized protein (TIGR00730 family)
MAEVGRISSVCVFCGSNNGNRPDYTEAAAALGREIARRGQRLVYGGGDVGTMGSLARSALGAGGIVTGIIPRRLYELVDHVELTELVVAEGMHDRKALMYERSDAFIALPGGIGTLDELFEAWTWRQIGYHAKPVGILDVAGYYRKLLDFLDLMSEEGFLSKTQLEDVVVGSEAGLLLDALAAKGPLKTLKRPERSRLASIPTGDESSRA